MLGKIKIVQKITIEISDMLSYFLYFFWRTLYCATNLNDHNVRLCDCGYCYLGQLKQFCLKVTLIINRSFLNNINCPNSHYTNLTARDVAIGLYKMLVAHQKTVTSSELFVWICQNQAFRFRKPLRISVTVVDNIIFIDYFCIRRNMRVAVPISNRRWLH